jgi:hypothetical protein
MKRRNSSPGDYSVNGSLPIHQHALSRRGLLKAIGGGAIAASALASGIRPAFAANGRPVRVVLLFTPHGAPAEFFWPKSIDDLSSSGGTVSILSPLQRHAKKLNVIRGIDYVGSDNHPAMHDAYCNHSGTSIDTSIAKRLAVKPLRLGVVPDYQQSFTVDGQLAFDGGVPQPHIADPTRVFDGLVADLPAGTGGGAPAPKPGPTSADFRKLALGVTGAELDELKSRAASDPKLDKHIAAIRSVTGASPSGSGPKAPIASCTTKPSLPSVEKLRGKNVWAGENFADVLAAQMDIATFALRCGLTRVVSIQCGYANNQIPFTWIGIGEGHHNLSHNSAGAPGRALHAKCQEWYATQWAKLLDNLDVPDPEDSAHTILDNSVVLWASEIADGQGHACQGIPIVMAGGGGGYLKTHQFLQLQSRSHGELLTAIGEAAGAPGIPVGNAPGGALREVKA